MAEVAVSSVVELLLSTVKQLIQNEINLVKGVDKELLDLSDKLNEVRIKLFDAETKHFKEKTVKDWLRRLELKSQEMEDVLEEWSYAIIQHTKMEEASSSKQKVCSFIPTSYFCFKKLQNLKLELDEILNEKGIYDFVASQPRIGDYSHASWRVQSTSLIDSAEIQGRNDDKEILVKKLIAHEEGLDYQILSIVGEGGLGKTTLAQLVYNDSRVEQCFASRIWICVSQPFEVEVIAKGIIEATYGERPKETTQLDDLLYDLIRCVSDRKFLLVLDDVWNNRRDKWECLRICLGRGGAGSKILVTTRKNQVARIMGSAREDIHHPKLLSNEDCLSLLMLTSRRSENKFDEFREIGKEIAKKCNGLPLAAKTLGSVLLPKKTVQEWEKLLNSEMWDLEHMKVELFPHLLLSYNELSPTHKHCFSFCAFFPKHKVLEVEELIGIWMALGYLGSNIGRAGDDMEFKGQEVFNDLALRALFQNFEKDESTEQIISCKMHDIVHDFVQFIRKNGRGEEHGMTKSTCHVCDPYAVSYVQEYRSLFWDQESPLNICDCMTSLRVLRYRQIHGSPRNIEKLIHLKWLDLSNTTLSKEDCETICKLYFLQTLFLRNCSIEEVPEEIENLVHLRYLDLRNNGELKELPENICRLVALQTLLLSECSLENIPREIGNLVHLKLLDLSENEGLEELPESICRLVALQTLLLSGCSLEKIPREIGNLVHLRLLDLSENEGLEELPESICRLVALQTLLLSGCSLEKIPTEIGNLIHLRFLGLSENAGLEELPESICRLVALQTLCLSRCSLVKIPRAIGNLVNLKHLGLRLNSELNELSESVGNLVKLQILDVVCCENLRGLPKELGQLSGLKSLQGFLGGIGCNKFGLLRNLSSLTELSISINTDGGSSIDMKELVEDAREAELRNKVHLTHLTFKLINERDEEDCSLPSSLWVDLMEALEPNRNLQDLTIWRYKGSRLPHWISSPLNLVRSIVLSNCLDLSSLPVMGKLPSLEYINIMGMKQLKVLGVEWLGIRGGERERMDSPLSSLVVLFPKLKSLMFTNCPEWLEWKDITAESTVVSIMSYLTYLGIFDCAGLKMLPHRLLRNASSLRNLRIRGSSKLVECYGDRDGWPWISISQNNPQLVLYI